MRFMVIVKGSNESEAGEMPSHELLAAMGKYNEELVNAGVLEAGEGLFPSSRGARVRFDGEERTVTAGPFGGKAEDLVGGFWIFRCASLDECIEWVKRSPNPSPGVSTIEIRPIVDAEAFGEAMTPELREQEDRIRAKAAANQE